MCPCVGFLSTEDSTVVSGNMGLSDQVMALRWVHENIERFRGRRDEITLIGHEAGAACVGIHMLSPISSKWWLGAVPDIWCSDPAPSLLSATFISFHLKFS